MTSTARSTKKLATFNDANEQLYDPYPQLLIGDENLASLPWPEWNDAELNSELWEEARKPKSKSAIEIKNRLSVVPVVFEDPSSKDIIPILRKKFHAFKRPHEVYPDINLTIYDPSNTEFVLSFPDSVADCSLLKYFSELLPILQVYALRYGFAFEFESPTFFPTFQGEPWRPWQHIYALCKAGKGQVHKPMYNPFGKYVVRLFYMGSWRKFVIDDKIPCDEEGNSLLPETQVKGELWPILLTKALFKIIVPQSNINFNDFSLLSAFTAWATEYVTTLNKSYEQIWRRLLILLPQYNASREQVESASSVKETVKTTSSKKGSTKEKKIPEKIIEIAEENFCFIMAYLEEFPEESYLGKQSIAILSTRDIPLGKYGKKEPTKPWKRIRWVYWAAKRGLWRDETSLPPYRRLEHISFVKEVDDLLAPDPSQEALMYDVSTEDENRSENQVSDTPYNCVQWSDFFRVCDYLHNLQFCFKPSCLPFKFKVTCLRSMSLEKAGHVESAKSSVKALPQNVYYLSPKLTPSQNKPTLMICESVTGIFLCASLSVYPRKPKNFFGYLDPEQPELLKIGHSSLIIERCDWRTLTQGEILGVIKTVGYSSRILNLNPGRHILKLWLTSDSPYVLDLFSNVPITVKQGSSIGYLMLNESEVIKEYINAVSEAFISLSSKFGKPNLLSSLRDFYTSILPGNDISLGYSKKIDDFIETFLQCILLHTKNVIQNVEDIRSTMGALQSLFVNPKIHIDLPKAPLSLHANVHRKSHRHVPIINEQTLSQILTYSWTTEEVDKITTIQRIFRGYRVRLLLKRQTPARKEFKQFADRLKKLCDVVFAPSKRESEVGKIIRNVVMKNPSLLSTFSFNKDFSNVIQMEEFTGKVTNAEPYAWLPLARFIIACHGDDPVPCAFTFSINLEHFVVQGVDNDTSNEIFRLTNCVSPYYYQNNDKGYSIIVYGWNEENVKTINWRLQMLQMKNFSSIHLCNTMLGESCHPYSMPTIDVIELKNFYIPNRNSRVCRCLIKVRKRTILTLRVSVSYREVHFVVTISLDKKFCPSDGEPNSVLDNVIARGKSTNGAVLLPSVILDYIEPNSWWSEANTNGHTESTLYVLEAFVMEDSWPLTKHEWGVVEPLRVNGETWADSSTGGSSRKGSESRKKLTRASKRTLPDQKTVENPCWMVQIVNSISEGEELGDTVLEEDKSYAESVRAMKISWEEKNPGRRKRGREIRYNFLYAIFLEDNNKLGDIESTFEESTYDTSDRDEEYGEDINFKRLLEQMSSFSYLTGDPSPLRFLKSPRILPPMPTTELLIKYTEDISLCEERSEGNAQSEFLKNVKDTLEEDKIKFLNRCYHYRHIVLNYLDQERKLSSRLMEQAYDSRQKALERLSR